MGYDKIRHAQKEGLKNNSAIGGLNSNKYIFLCLKYSHWGSFRLGRSSKYIASCLSFYIPKSNILKIIIMIFIKVKKTGGNQPQGYAAS